MLRQATEQRGQVARTGADFQHPLARLHQQLLQQARVNLRGQHAVAFFQRLFGGAQQGDFHVHEGHATVGGGREIFTWHLLQQLQHRFVRDVPGADLLLHHVVARDGSWIVGVVAGVQGQGHEVLRVEEKEVRRVFWDKPASLMLRAGPSAKAPPCPACQIIHIAIDHRHHYQCEQRGGDDAANHRLPHRGALL